MNLTDNVVIVTGGRSFKDRGLMNKTLGNLKPTLVVQGGAHGADWFAAECWKRRRPARVEAVEKRDAFYVERRLR